MCCPDSAPSIVGSPAGSPVFQWKIWRLMAGERHSLCLLLSSRQPLAFVLLVTCVLLCPQNHLHHFPPRTEIPATPSSTALSIALVFPLQSGGIAQKIVSTGSTIHSLGSRETEHSFPSMPSLEPGLTAALLPKGTFPGRRKQMPPSAHDTTHT